MNVTSRCLLVFTLMFTVFFSGISQENLPIVSSRLNNPQFDPATGKLVMDLELKSNLADQQPFGMNVRFFYDAAQLEFIELDGLPAGYDILGEPPIAKVGNSSSGYQLFSMEREAAFVNGAVQLFQPGAGFEIPASGWTKFFELHFQLTQDALETEGLFYPTVILDAKGDRKGGFLRGSDGIVLTLVDQDPSSFTESKPSIVSVEHFNWQYEVEEQLPFGQPVKINGVTLGDIVSSASNQTGQGKYILYQNYPNPVYNNTSIGFYLPKASEVTLRFFDTRGSEIGALSGNFPAGDSSIDVNQSNLLTKAEVLFYRMEVDDYVSESLKMIIIDN